MFASTLLRIVLSVGATLLVGTAHAADRGPYAPENIENTEKGFYWVCMVRPICPVSEKVRDLVKRVIGRDRAAEYELGVALVNDEEGMGDPDIGLVWIAHAAERGEPRAARDIAARLHSGSTIDIDEAKVIEAIKPQADSGDLESIRALAALMIAGRGVGPDVAAAVALLQQAAKNGSSGAEYDLAQLYMSGAQGFPANHSEAVKWFVASARHGNVDAMVSLGFASVDAPASTRNLAKGYCWLMRAALLDNPQAQEKLSAILASGDKDDHGTVISSDLAQAALWFRLAARKPAYDNPQIRARIEPQMSAAQFDEVQRQLEHWRPHNVQELKSLTVTLPATSQNCPAF